MKMKYITRIRLMCGIHGIDSNIISEKWLYKELDYSEESMDELLSCMDQIVTGELADTYWVEYFVPVDDEWYTRDDLPAVCLGI